MGGSGGRGRGGYDNSGRMGGGGGRGYDNRDRRRDRPYWVLLFSFIKVGLEFVSCFISLTNEVGCLCGFSYIWPFSCVFYFRGENSSFLDPCLAIPSEIGLLPKIEEIWLHITGLVGTMPEEICEIRGVGFLELLNANCAETNGFEHPALDCTCCTTCCDAAAATCATAWVTGNIQLVHAF